MNKPLLIIITGRPASGKTTLAHILSKKIKFPILSRDELKEGYLNTMGMEHNQLNNSVGWHIYKTFFETIDLLVSKNISIIVEAAFQNKLWKPQLLKLLSKSEIKIILCETSPDLTRSRFIKRFLTDPGRERFHGDKSLYSAANQVQWINPIYEPVNIDVPILEVDTTENYKSEY